MKILFTTLIVFFSSSCSFATDESSAHLRDMSKAFSNIAKKSSPTVVFIKTEKTQLMSGKLHFFFPFGEELFNHFFKNRMPKGQTPKKRSRKVVVQGSGFIVSSDGHILTNNHLVDDADKVTVKLLDGRELTAKVVGTDEHSDIAVIKIKAKNLPILPLGDSDKLNVGEWVVALGNPFGLSHSLTAGVVSAIGRSSLGIANYENFIQTDAAINPGNSGGPLINLDGEVVGMNTAIFSRSGGYMGIGFATPINMVKKIKEQLIKEGKVTRGYLGVAIQSLTKELAEQFDIKDLKGILVSDVEEDTQAQRAGFKIGDVIVKFNGREVKEVPSFRNMVALTPPGKEKTVVVVRNGRQKKLRVKIGTLPTKKTSSKRSQETQESDFGFSVGNLTPLMREQFGFPPKSGGVIVTSIDLSSVAAMAGIKPGLLIKEVNKRKVNSVAEFEKAVKKSKRKGSILLLVQDREFSRFITL
ncbi:MAG: DegQ family serine endoprotease [Bacteriovoracaceae bacterium]|jgi:serine protease Do|nr:DegQ family serine endoprotease [Bacteriovoracaceae bacterium]